MTVREFIVELEKHPQDSILAIVGGLTKLSLCTPELEYLVSHKTTFVDEKKVEIGKPVLVVTSRY